MVLEGSDLDSLLSAGVHDTDSKPTDNVNESVPEKKIVLSDDDDNDEEMVEPNSGDSRCVSSFC